MRNHIVFKFLAVALCAASLLGAVTSGVGMLALTELGLYDQTLEEAKAEQVDSLARGLAQDIGIRYAATELGGVSEAMADSCYGELWNDYVFDWAHVGYKLRHGEELLQEKTLTDGTEPAYVLEYALSGEYIRVLGEMTQQEYNLLYQPELAEPTTSVSGEHVVYNALPEEGVEVYQLELSYADGSSEGITSPEGLGYLSYIIPDGRVIFNANDASLLGDLELERVPTRICFLSAGGQIIYEANNPDGVLEEWSRSSGIFYMILCPITPEPEATEAGEPFVTYNAVPVDGVSVGQIDYRSEERGDCGAGGENCLLGYLNYDDGGNVVFLSTPNALGPMVTELNHLTYVAFYDLDGNLVYEANGGVLYPDDQNQAVYQPVMLLDVEPNNVVLYDAIPPEGMRVCRISVKYADGFSESVGGVPEIGTLSYEADGTVVFVANSAQILSFRADPVTQISFWDEYDNLAYQANDPSGVGYFYLSNNGEGLFFRAEAPETGDVLGVVAPGEYGSYSAVPEEGAQVFSVTATYADETSDSIGDASSIGQLAYDSTGRVVFYTETAVQMRTGRVVRILFFDADRNVLYAAECADGVGELTATAGGELRFVAEDPLLQVTYDLAEAAETEPVAAAEIAAAEAPSDGGVPEETTVPAVTEVPAEPVAEETTVPAVTEVPAEPVAEETVVPAVTEVPAETIMEETVVPGTTEDPAAEPAPAKTDMKTEPVIAAEEAASYWHYYDYETGQDMVAEYTLEPMPDYSLVLYLVPGAYKYEYEWVLMEAAYSLRQELPKILGVCLLLFAVTAVYLCCAAGKKPGSTEVRAGGLNCISLDAYLGVGFLGILVLFWLGAEGTRYLLPNSAQTGLVFAGLMAYGVCLIFVGFCFACAAQFKTPGGYWWHNSLCGRLVKLLTVAFSWLLRTAEWLAVKMEGRVWPAVVRGCRAAWKMIRAVGALLWKGILAGLALLEKGTNWLAMKLNRFYSLLPVTWQFLLTGFVLVFLLYIMMRTYKVGYILLGFGIFFGVLLYAASSFGILLEAAKRMSKGDLDEKVDDKLLAGCFREFAGELNSLADVAVVAAQKQLKSERMKTELITNVSHDIKTPLTSIINYVDLLRKPHTQEQQEVYLEVLDRQSQRLKKLIEDLMEMSKASTGNMAVEIGIVDAAEAINQSLGEFADKLERASLTPVFRQPEEPVAMLADGRLVWRVMSNLLGNAVKYALPGTRIYLDLMAVDGKVIISMKNISREELNVSADELLERFVRGDASRNTEGSGLGLNIAQSLMELQKGQLQLLVDGDLFKVTLIFPGA